MIINELVSRRKLKLRGEMVFQQEEGKSINAKVKMEKRHLLIDFQTPTRSISHSNDWPLREKQFLIVFKIFKFIFAQYLCDCRTVNHTVISSLHFLKILLIPIFNITSIPSLLTVEVLTLHCSLLSWEIFLRKEHNSTFTTKRSLLKLRRRIQS